MGKLGKIIVAFVQEYYFIITYPVIEFFHDANIYRNPYPKGTIVLVTCWFTPNVYHEKWASYLEKKGFRTYLLHLPFLHESFQQTAKRLDNFITENKLKKFTLVGISTGAVVCLYFLNLYKKWSSIYKFISVGGPLHGSFTALFVAFAGKGRVMLPGSQFVQKLERIPIPPNKMITISAEFDELVPKKSSTIHGNTSYIIPVWGHNRFHLSSKATYDLIVKIAGKT